MLRQLLFITFTGGISLLHAAGEDSMLRKQQLSVIGGLMHDSYNSGGFRLMVSYQRSFRKHQHWFWGIGYDTKLGLYRPATDIYDPPMLTTQNFSANIHYQKFIWKNRIGWDAGMGPTLVHAMEWDRYTMNNWALFGVHLTAHLNIRLGKKLCFQTAPLFFIPFASDLYVLNREAYISPLRGYRTYLQYSVIPLGLRFDL